MIAEPRTRSGRLRLIARLDTAQRAGELLRSKEEALVRERVRLDGYATRAREDWQRAFRDAGALLVRARMLGASDELERWLDRGTATVEHHWQTAMGVAYPGDVDVVAGARPKATSTAALGPAIEGYRAALDVAARLAAATTAVRRIEAELVATRRRRRAIDDRLRPVLERELHEVDQFLDELDRDEATRVRLASARRDVGP